MLQYIYSPGEFGITEWPSGMLRLEGIEVTTDPEKADVFVCPGNFRLFAESGIVQIDRLRRLPYFVGNESRHAFLDVSDDFKAAINLPVMLIRCDVRTWMLPSDPNTIQMAWPVGNNLDGKFEDFAECMPVPQGGFDFDLSCHHWTSTRTRIDAANSCDSNAALKCDIVQYGNFTGYLMTPTHKEYDPEEGGRRWRAYRSSLQRSRVALCGESIPGVVPYRFFECIAAGRVPLLVGSDYVLPFHDEIPWEQFSWHIAAKDAHLAGKFIQEKLLNTSDDELIRMGKLARHWWESLLNGQDWPRIMAYAVRKKLGKLAP